MSMIYIIQDDPRKRMFNTEDDAIRGLIELIHAFWLTDVGNITITNSANQTYYGSMAKFSLVNVQIKIAKPDADVILLPTVTPSWKE